jgi:Na+/H+ antiporter NhaD/arsenite permease-like protein
MKLTVNRALLLVLGVAYIAIGLIRRSFYSDGLVDWKTVAILSSLIVVNTGLMYSDGLSFISYKIIHVTKDRRQLVILSIILTAFLAMFLTNDVSLLILIPITVSIGKFTGKNSDDIIIFQAIAANVGSMLTPFGNPQNIIIFRTMNLNSSEFIYAMLPIFLSSMVILLFFTFIFRNEKITPSGEIPKPNFPFFYTNLLLLSVALAGILANASIFIFIVIIVLSFISFAVFEPRAIIKVDYVLIVVFILIFLVMNSLRFFVKIPTGGGTVEIFFLSLILSQFISNVPTTVLFGKVVNWTALTYGVDIGGNGTIIASLANIIALRNISGRNFMKFNKYSFLFLVITAIIGLIILLR